MKVKSQLSIFCEVSSCENVSQTVPTLTGLVGTHKKRPMNWSGEAFDNWRVWSENSNKCFFGLSQRSSRQEQATQLYRAQTK